MLMMMMMMKNLRIVVPFCQKCECFVGWIENRSFEQKWCWWSLVGRIAENRDYFYGKDVPASLDWWFDLTAVDEEEQGAGGSDCFGPRHRYHRQMHFLRENRQPSVQLSLPYYMESG